MLSLVSFIYLCNVSATSSAWPSTPTPHWWPPAFISAWFSRYFRWKINKSLPTFSNYIIVNFRLFEIIYEPNFVYGQLPLIDPKYISNQSNDILFSLISPLIGWFVHFAYKNSKLPLSIYCWPIGPIIVMFDLPKSYPIADSSHHKSSKPEKKHHRLPFSFISMPDVKMKLVQVHVNKTNIIFVLFVCVWKQSGRSFTFLCLSDQKPDSDSILQLPYAQFNIFKGNQQKKKKTSSIKNHVITFQISHSLTKKRQKKKPFEQLRWNKSKMNSIVANY